MKDLLFQGQTISPFHRVLPESIVESFKLLQLQLSERIDVDQAVQLANSFGLAVNMTTKIRQSRSPGSQLLDILVSKSLVSPDITSPQS